MMVGDTGIEPAWSHRDHEVAGSREMMVGDTGIEPVTSSVSGKRATAAPIAHSHGVLLVEPKLRGACEVATGFEPVCTALQAAASPLGHATVGNSPPHRGPLLERMTRFELATLTLAR